MTEVIESAELIDNSRRVGGKMVLKEGTKYMRHLPSGRVSPYEEQGAKRDDVEIFLYKKSGETKINKPPKPKRKGPFQRESGPGPYGTPTDRVIDLGATE